MHPMRFRAWEQNDLRFPTQSPLARSNNITNTLLRPIAPLINTPSFSFSPMNQPFTIKLDSGNYLIWKN